MLSNKCDIPLRFIFKCDNKIYFLTMDYELNESRAVSSVIVFSTYAVISFNVVVINKLFQHDLSFLLKWTEKREIIKSDRNAPI